MISYINGTYQVQLLSNGTKIRSSPDGIFNPIRPETLDINISNYCKHNCSFCYIDASTSGQHGDLFSQPFWDTIPPYTELALNYSPHPSLGRFLMWAEYRKLIVNLTINYRDLQELAPQLVVWQESGFIHGIGVSVGNFLPKVPEGLKHVVFHTIAGITSPTLLTLLAKGSTPILILGFKTKGRAGDTVPDLSPWKALFPRLLHTSNIISFDNLAISQLEVQQHLPTPIWNAHYMGAEGTSSFYIDTVTNRYFKSSTESEGFPVDTLSIQQMFKHIKSL